jgi:hypothetical protein
VDAYVHSHINIQQYGAEVADNAHYCEGTRKLSLCTCGPTNARSMRFAVQLMGALLYAESCHVKRKASHHTQKRIGLAALLVPNEDIHGRSIFVKRLKCYSLRPVK